MTSCYIFHFCKMEKMIVSTLEGCEKQLMYEKCLLNPGPRTEKMPHKYEFYVFIFILIIIMAYLIVGTSRKVSGIKIPEGSLLRGIRQALSFFQKELKADVKRGA